MINYIRVSCPFFCGIIKLRFYGFLHQHHLSVALPFYHIDATIETKQRGRKKTVYTATVISQKLEQARKARSILQKEAAAEIGVATTTYGQWEGGKCEPDSCYMPKIIAFLGGYPYPEPKTIGEKIKKYRLTHGLTPKEFGLLCNVTEAAVLTWEREKHRPNKTQRPVVEKLLSATIQSELSL